ncbi:hypothetical protein F4782DRAFT_104968 [Xylaria castorea]|nr:hypothetical protein F4782DRAFT_104968 [Xylaria castorea]
MKARIDERPPPETFNSIVDLGDAVPHTSKKPMADSPSDLDTSAESPEIWPSIEDQPDEQDPDEAIRWEWRQQVTEGYNRTENTFAQARQEYARFRQNRLPSPAASEDEPAVVYDSEADEFGYVPLMFGLENDDPRVEEVFGTSYYHRLQERRARYQTAAPIQTITTFEEPWPGVDAEHSGSESSDQPLAAIEARADRMSSCRSQTAIRPSTRPRRRPRFDCDGFMGLDNVPTSRLRSSKPLHRKTRARVIGQRDKEPSFTQMLTRWSGQQKFYELDHYGTARLLSKN